MPVYKTPDGRYTYAIETPNEADGNSVVYDHWRENPDAPGNPFVAWDRWSYEASIGSTQGPFTPAPAPHPGPAPVPTPIPDPTPQPVPRDLRIIQVTNASDGELVPRQYSYWPNALVIGRAAYVFAGHRDGHTRFFKVDLITGSVDRLGSPIGFTGEAEGWYWDAESWVYLIDGPRLRRENPFTGQSSVVFDISDSHPGCVLWQAHSSDDGRVHSATVKQGDEPYTKLGTIVYHNGRDVFFDSHGDLDESQITPDGGWVVIKETFPAANGKVDLTNRVIAIPSRETRVLHNVDGAVGHSDCGPGLLIGEWSPQFDTSQHGQCVLWDLRGPLVPERRRELFATWNMGHVSYRGGRCLVSDDTHLSLVSLNGGGVVQLVAHGGETGTYDKQIKANLDPSGRVATYMPFQQGRFDVYLLVIPD